MKNLFSNTLISSLLIFTSNGSNVTNGKIGTLSQLYAVTTVLSLVLLIACCLLLHKKKAWFILLFSSVFVVNIGYTALSFSPCLEMALWSNRIAYLGSVFLPLSMLMIILNVTNTKYTKWVPRLLFAVAVLVFLLAASPGFLPLYYKDVSFAVIDGVSKLIKVYGPLHPLYLIYLLGYFLSMVTVITRAQIKNTVHSPYHAIILAIAVFVNIGVWLIEQLVDINFEMLSVSYIISELFLLGIHLVANENNRLAELVKQVESSQKSADKEINTSDTMLETIIEPEAVAPERIEVFIQGINQLTPTEKLIYDAYIARVTTKEVMANLNIKESTLKYHNRNIYGKLGVSSRMELLEIHKHLKSLKNKLDNSTVVDENGLNK
ncbi:MAG: hypothetical protein IJC94_07835 [Oscillospiraceae bacterium]|nr:hypothetical protein [Oscillospiraceae bacterium]